MLAERTGAVAHYGATANSYTSENHERAKGIFAAIFDDGYARLAPALGRAEGLSRLSMGGGDSWDNNTFAYLLLGDPELSIRKEPVPGIRWELVTDFTASSLIVKAQTSPGDPVANAFINLELIDGTFVNGFADEGGVLTFGGIESGELKALNAMAEGYLPLVRDQGVTDTEAPVLEIAAESPLVWEAGVPFVAPKATAKDLLDGDVSENIRVDVFVDISVPGNMYHVTYSVSDKAGNQSSYQLFVQVVDAPQSKLRLINYFSFANGNLSIHFSGKLQQSDSVLGPWTDVKSAESPYEVETIDAKKFYRAVSMINSD
jgi:hypothetical protein